jgi:hypothetical protein
MVEKFKKLLEQATPYEIELVRRKLREIEIKKLREQKVVKLEDWPKPF